jgi:hypothetical protein
MPTAMGGLSAKKTNTSGGRRLSAPRPFGKFRSVPALTSSALAKREREIPTKRERLVEIQKSRKPRNLVSDICHDQRNLDWNPLRCNVFHCLMNNFAAQYGLWSLFEHLML